MGKTYIRVSNASQVFMLKHPNAVTRWLLQRFYDFEVVDYTLVGAQKFLLDREEILGPNFGALGKLIVGSHEDVARHILAPQKRASFLARFQLIEDRLSDYFMLFISDKGAGGEELFEHLYELVWDLILAPAIQRAKEPAAQAEIEQFVEAAYALGQPPSAKDLAKPLEEFIIRWVTRVVLEVEVTDDQLDALYKLAFVNTPFEGFVVSRARPLAPPKVPEKVQANEDLFCKLVDESPVMAGFDAANKHNLDRQRFVQLMVEILIIAGFGGSENLANSLLTKGPVDHDVDVSDSEAVEKVVLETARRWAPVNNVNAIAQEPVEFNVNGKSHTFPTGTVMSLCLCLGNLDAKTFPKPKEFDPERANLCPHLLSFNSVGNDGARECPGREVAVSLNSQLLVAWRAKFAAAAAG